MSLEEHYEKYQKTWYFQTRYEHMFMIIWHAIFNFFHCLPVWIAGSKILAHSTRLEENGFVQTRSEEEALKSVKTLMISSPIVVAVIVPLIQCGTLIIYYKYGHPWCRIFKHFKKPGTTRPKTVKNEKTDVSV